MERRGTARWLERPQVQNVFLWNAFQHLRGSRTANGTIPFSEIIAYCEHVGIDDPVHRNRLIAAITALDNVNGPTA